MEVIKVILWTVIAIGTAVFIFSAGWGFRDFYEDKKREEEARFQNDVMREAERIAQGWKNNERS